jgi:hypothetical protein
MKFRIVLFYDENRNEIGQLSEGVARAYCTRHGYDLAVHRKLYRPDMHPAFSVTKAMALEMDQHPEVDWVLRLDSDAIIVNQDFKLEQLVEATTCSLLGTDDCNGLCTGVFMIKNSGWSVKLLDMLDFLGEMSADQWCRYDHQNTFEQNTLKCLIRHFPRVAHHVSTIPQNVIQNPKSMYNANAFMMHYWSDSGLPMIADKMREVIANGWSRKAFYQWGS